MSDYVFIISERGGRTNILCDFELITLNKLIECLKEDIEIKKYNEGKAWNERKKTHILEWGKKIRIAKINEAKNFQTRILKYIKLEEFEEIFKEHIDDIEPLLEYSKYGEKYFRMEILKKYGTIKEK